MNQTAEDTETLVPGESLAALVEAEIREGRVELPVLPEAAARVRAIIANDGGAPQIVAVIEREPALAAAVLRYANSVAYAGLREITNLQQAVMRLGFGAVERTVLALSAKNAFSATDKRDEHVYRKLWNHSVTTALAARRLAPRSPAFSSETVFLAGLLHDIGKLVVMRTAVAMRHRDPEHCSFSQDTLIEFFDALHCKVGEVLCDAWNIPAEIRDVISRHHDEHLAGAQDLLVATVQVANLMSRKIGASLKPDPNVSILGSPAASMLRLDDVRIATLLVEIEDDLAAMQDVI
jgi:putative nucleotidyltransferase with HDIG domain